MRLALILLISIYPFLVWWGLSRLSLSWVALLLLALFVARLFLRDSRRGPLAALLWPMSAFGAGLALLALLAKDEQWLRLYPVGVNLLLLISFLASFLDPPPMIERFARLYQSQLPDQAVAYTRKVTWWWCGFFVVNGGVALATSFASMELWTWYNGCISYVLIGLMMGIEWLIRKRVAP